MEKSAVVIFRDGRTISATYVRGENEIATAKAKCNLSDKFDFVFGANLATQRLMKKVVAESCKKKSKKRK